MIAYVILHALYYYSNFHKNFGIWQCNEPKSHFNFAMATSWIVALFMVGEISRKIFYYMEDTHLEQDVVAGVKKVVFFEVDDKYKFIKSQSLGEDIFWGVIGFYAIDFLR